MHALQPQTGDSLCQRWGDPFGCHAGVQVAEKTVSERCAGPFPCLDAWHVENGVGVCLPSTVRWSHESVARMYVATPKEQSCRRRSRRRW